MDRAMVFGKYCLLERISVGGMAEVFRAKPLPAHQSDKMLALKRILPHLAEDDEFITMFVDEAKLTVALDHPNIVETYELGNFQSSYYILMEYIAGQDVLALQKRLRKNRRIMSVAQACYVASRVARGLHYAHTACDEEGRPFNIIHRDVSPQNIRLTWDGRVKLIDFGIAKAAVQRTKTQVGVLKGKFGYMSPEQVRGEDIDHRSDVFALGTTLWEMLTNRRLFNGENEYETLQMVKHPEIPPPSEKNAQVPPAVDDIVMGALDENRDRRFQSCAELGDALAHFVSGLREPYTQDHLSEWLAQTFPEELEEERRKRELYREIKTTEDVRRFNRGYADGAALEGGEVSGGEQSERSEYERRAPEDEIWDPDFAPDDGEEVDPEEFAADHTVVAAGGFDPSQFDDDHESGVISLADDDIIELQDEESAEVSAPNRTASSGASAEPPPEQGRDGAVAAEAGRSRSADGASDVKREISVDGGSGTRPGADRTGTAEAASERSDRLRLVSALVAVVVVLGLGGTIMYQMVVQGNGTRGAGGPKASMVISVRPNPPTDGEVLVDGEVRGRRGPVTLSELSPGTHRIEVRYPGFQEIDRRIRLRPGELKTVMFRLDRDPNARNRIHLEMPETEGDVRVFLDGKETSWQQGEPLFVGPGRHLLEVVAPEKEIWSRIVEVSSGDSLTEHVRLEPGGVELRIESDETAAVTMDGEEVGETPVEFDDLAATELHEVELTSTESDASWTSTLGFPRLGRGRLQVGFGDAPARHSEEDYGWLEVSTGEDWWSVMIDGTQTARRTPVEESNRIPLLAGTRTITLRRGNDMHEFDVEIEGGETTHLEETLPFEWTDSEL